MNMMKVVLSLVAIGAAVLQTQSLVFAQPKGRTIEVAVTDKGFEPAEITVKKGEPITLVITRKVEQTCAKEIIIDEHKINAKLPLNKPVKVTFTPKKTGELKYGCHMDKMIGGVLRVE